MNLIGELERGTIVAVKPECVRPEFSADVRARLEGGPGMTLLRPEWQIYVTWNLDRAHGIISADMLESIVFVPDETFAPMSLLEQVDWIEGE